MSRSKLAQNSTPWSLRRRLYAAVAAVSLTYAPPSLGDAPPDITAQERALLPLWCNYVQGSIRDTNGRQIYDGFVRRYGGGWTHMHHYCWALVDIMRMDRYAARDRPGFASWGRARGNIDYVLRSTDGAPQFPFRSQMLAKKARLLARYSTPDEASLVAKQLIDEWPQVADGYVIMAELFVRAGKRGAAIKILDEAASNVSDKAELARQRSLMKLD